MHQQDRSTKTRRTLPLNRPSSYQPVASNDPFVETIRLAVEKLPKAGSKVHRVLYGAENCLTALKGLLVEAVERGAQLDDVRRVQESVNRACRGFIRENWPHTDSAGCIKVAIGAETTANSHQNEDTHAVLTCGTIGDAERLLESSRIQRDMSQAVMESAEVRIAELRMEAALS